MHFTQRHRGTEINAKNASGLMLAEVIQLVAPNNCERHRLPCGREMHFTKRHGDTEINAKDADG